MYEYALTCSIKKHSSFSFIKNTSVDYYKKCKIIILESFALPYYEDVKMIHLKEYYPAKCSLKKYCFVNKIDIIHQY